MSRSTPSRLALLGSVLEAFWWQRYTAAGDGAMTPDQVERVVDDVLLPIIASASAPRRGRSRPGSDRAQPARRMPTPGQPVSVRVLGRPVHGVGRALHLAEQPVGHVLTAAAVRSGSAPSVTPGALPDHEGRGRPRSQTAAMRVAAASGSRRRRRRSSAAQASSSARRSRSSDWWTQFALVGAQRVRGLQRGDVAAALGAAHGPDQLGDDVDEVRRAAPTAVATEGSRSRTASAGRVDPGRAPVEEELFLRGEVVEHRLDGDVGLAGDVGDRHGRRSRARRRAAARPSGSAPGSVPSCVPDDPVVHPPSQHNHGPWSSARRRTNVIRYWRVAADAPPSPPAPSGPTPRRAPPDR